MERELAKRLVEQSAAKDSSKGGGGDSELDHWLTKGIIVKIMAKALKDAGYYKAKGEVIRVIDVYVAEVEVLDTGDVVRVDQSELETVRIPYLHSVEN